MLKQLEINNLKSIDKEKVSLIESFIDILKSHITMDKKMDRRVLKTKRAIYNAFVELLSEKEINHITITDISKKADINRKTFYNYYSNTYEVMEEIENLMVGFK